MAGAIPLFTADFASGQSSCDFVTGGGFIIPDPATGAHGNFGVGGGCKNNGPNAPFWGHLEYLDHGSYPPGSTATVPPPFNVHGTGVTGYFFVGPTIRDISGTARTNDPSHSNNVNYCVEVSDNDPSGTDTFQIQLTDTSGLFYDTGPQTLGDGNIELHKPNPSTRTGSFSSGTSCLVSTCAGAAEPCVVNPGGGSNCCSGLSCGSNGFCFPQ